MTAIHDIVRYLDTHLGAARFQDAAINGLQVEGRAEVASILVGVSACRRLFEEAISGEYDAVLVHHGLLWDRPRAVVGPLAERLRLLLANKVSLIAYHLPLDAHPVDGNNACLATAIGLLHIEPWGTYRGQVIGCKGRFEGGRALDALVADVDRICGATALVMGQRKPAIERVAVCSGGAGDLLDLAIADGADVYITGEPGEPSQALAREAGIVVIGAGHHNTERLGVQALARRLSADLGIRTRFFDIPNPV
jgi:dinuclear metal center YbgI/SA1388 family protein